MELRLLSADEDDLVDPDEEIIRTALTRLPKFSGGRPARAVLVHDNGKDFIQFVVKKKDGRKNNCYVQYCENQEGGDDPSQFFAEKKTTEDVINLFQLYAAGDPDWRGKISWKPFKPKWPLYRGLRTSRQINILANLLAFGFFGLFAGLVFLIPLAFGEADELAVGVVIGVSLLCLSSVIWLRPAKAGVPWIATNSSGGSNSHGGCSSGSCGSGGGGDGGGGGGGGGCGGGGCGGGE